MIFCYIILGLFVLLWGGGCIIYLLRKYSILKPFTYDELKYFDFLDRQAKIPPSLNNNSSGFLWFS